ncbi:unnamed protein product [Caenorhabditis angaria]|uniref:Uncharacterized protein n=1 Tax=Caenorhabditis angaria TaxID=860376 RepID=A0A9P1MU72_9PELO|nr:unnamed protein product [Caenorhabditis angaria]
MCVKKWKDEDRKKNIKSDYKKLKKYCSSICVIAHTQKVNLVEIQINRGTIAQRSTGLASSQRRKSKLEVSSWCWSVHELKPTCSTNTHLFDIKSTQDELETTSLPD